MFKPESIREKSKSVLSRVGSPDESERNEEMLRQQAEQLILSARIEMETKVKH